MLQHLTTRLAFNVILLALSACGGGGSGAVNGIKSLAADPPPAPSGDRTFFVVGSKAPDSGLVVHRQRYDADDAIVTINGDPAELRGLTTGQILRITGTERGNGVRVANKIDVYANAIGPVEFVDLAQGLLVVLGQTVKVDDQTIIAGDLAAAETYAEVSGYLTPNGDILATLIEVVARSSDVRAFAVVSELDPGAFEFRLNGLQVEYGKALVTDIPGGHLRDGVNVFVRGRLDAAGILVAEAVFGVDGQNAFALDQDVSVTGYYPFRIALQFRRGRCAGHCDTRYGVHERHSR